MGAGGGGGGFFGTSLFCADGSSPEASRSGSIGIPKGYIPRGQLVAGKELAVDAWGVSCPGGESVAMFLSMYREGPRCAPRGFKFAPASAERAYVAAGNLLDDGKPLKALEAIDSALLLDDRVVTFHHRRGVILMVAKRFADAEAALARAMGLSKPGLYLRLHHGISQMAQGKRPPYARTVAALRAEIGAKHRLRAELDCRHAINEHHLGRTAKVRKLAASACGAGYEVCCTFPPASGN